MRPLAPPLARIPSTERRRSSVEGSCPLQWGYMLDSRDPSSLILRPFAGDPTAYVPIPVTQGICGTAAASGETVLTDDVNADPRYPSGSTGPKSGSEILVPTYRLSSESPVLQGGEVKSACTALYFLSRNDTPDSCIEIPSLSTTLGPVRPDRL